TISNGFTSQPFVLLDYLEADRRLAMRAFKVLREKPQAGITFEYTRTAGTILQPPMPLPLLETPLARSIPGQPPKSLNMEIGAYIVTTSVPTPAGSYTSHTLTTSARHFAKKFEPLALQNPTTPVAPVWLFPSNLTATTLGGLVSDLRPLSLKVWSGAQNALSNRWRFSATIPAGLVASAAPALIFDTITTNLTNNWPISVTEVNTNSQ